MAEQGFKGNLAGVVLPMILPFKRILPADLQEQLNDIGVVLPAFDDRLPRRTAHLPIVVLLNVFFEPGEGMGMSIKAAGLRVSAVKIKYLVDIYGCDSTEFVMIINK